MGLFVFYFVIHFIGGWRRSVFWFAIYNMIMFFFPLAMISIVASSDQSDVGKIGLLILFFAFPAVHYLYSYPHFKFNEENLRLSTIIPPEEFFEYARSENLQKGMDYSLYKIAYFYTVFTIFSSIILAVLKSFFEI